MQVQSKVIFIGYLMMYFYIIVVIIGLFCLIKKCFFLNKITYLTVKCLINLHRMKFHNIKVNDEQSFRKACIMYEILLHHKKSEYYSKIISNLELQIHKFESNFNVEPPLVNDGDILQFIYENEGITQYQLSEKLTVSQPLINRILKQNIRISKNLADKLSELYDFKMSLFRRY